MGCRRITSSIGVRSTLFSASSFEKIGVSRMPSRIQSPIATRIRLRKNGTRQPQLRNASPDIWEKARTARLARNRPHGTPNCGQEAMKPRDSLPRAHSIESSTEPPHSPPMPMPCRARSTVRMMAPQTPMSA